MRDHSPSGAPNIGSNMKISDKEFTVILKSGKVLTAEVECVWSDANQEGYLVHQIENLSVNQKLTTDDLGNKLAIHEKQEAERLLVGEGENYEWWREEL